MRTIDKYFAELVQAQLNNRKPAPIPEEVSLQELITLSRKNHMDYMILGGLLKTDNLPEEYIPALRRAVMTSLFRTTTQITEFRELIKRFEENQVKNQPMKGSLMRFMYPSPELREMSDIDVLIEKESWERGVKVMTDMGYHLHEAIKHHDIYMKKPYMVLEAHRAMYDKTVDSNQYEYFKNMSKAVLREGYQYSYDFTPEDFYIYMIAHMAKHFYKMGCGVRNLVDIYVYNQKFGETMDKAYVDKELKSLGLLDFTNHMVKLANIWLGEDEEEEFYDQLFDYMLGSGIYGKDENGIWNKFCEEKMQDKEVTRKRLKTWYLFPPLHYMAEYYPWLEEHAFLLPVAWGIRAFRGVFLHKGEQKRHMINEIEQDQIAVYKKIYQEMNLRFK